MIEVGPHTLNNLAHVQPARYALHGAADSKVMKFVTAKPSEALGGRAAVVPGGRCVGGGSSVNCEAAQSQYLMNSSDKLKVMVSHDVHSSLRF